MSFPWATLGKTGSGKCRCCRFSALVFPLTLVLMGGSQVLQQLRVRCDFFLAGLQSALRRSLGGSWLVFPSRLGVKEALLALARGEEGPGTHGSLSLQQGWLTAGAD